MKTGQVIKTFDNISDEEMALVNSYSRKELKSEDVYLFSVVLCDNDIDRDNERFTVESLFELEKLFVGKTGIVDHSMKAENMTARIISCSVEAIEGRKTVLGDDYFRLVARAYIPRTKKNEDFIDMIDTGILKEVSVGCAVEKNVCSICSNDIHSNACSHTKGEKYGSKLCFGELISPTDAYEFSFVAVPAQKGAGVIKAHKRKADYMENIRKALEKGEEITLSKSQSENLFEYIVTLEKGAEDAKLYREDLTKSVVKLSALCDNELKTETLEKILSKLCISEIKELKAAYEKRAEKTMPVKPQLFSKSEGEKTHNNTQFTI